MFSVLLIHISTFINTHDKPLYIHTGSKCIFIQGVFTTIL